MLAPLSFSCDSERATLLRNVALLHSREAELAVLWTAGADMHYDMMCPNVASALFAELVPAVAAVAAAAAVLLLLHHSSCARQQYPCLCAHNCQLCFHVRRQIQSLDTRAPQPP